MDSYITYPYQITDHYSRYRGTNYFSFFVSLRFASNKTQLTEFPESKSDMPLIPFGLGFKIKKNIWHVQKSQDTSS